MFSTVRQVRHAAKVGESTDGLDFIKGHSWRAAFWPPQLRHAVSDHALSSSVTLALLAGTCNVTCLPVHYYYSMTIPMLEGTSSSAVISDRIFPLSGMQ